MDQHEIIIARTEDKMSACRDYFCLTTLGFLTPAEQAVVRRRHRELGGVHLFFYGGYEEAERRMALFAPTFLAETLEDALALEQPLRVLHIKKRSGGRELTHRDYLGSVLSLGLDRAAIGDILVREDGADMIIRADAEAFLLSEYHAAGRTELTVTAGPMEEMEPPKQHTEEVNDTVASLRLDSVIASAFRLSRAEAAKAVRSGLVYRNSEEEVRVDKTVEEGDILTLRRKGKVRLAEIGGESRKGRIWIRILRYL